MRFQFGNYELEIEVIATQAVYKKLPFAVENCACDGCQNYQAAIPFAPKQVLSFFSSIGVDTQKPCEIYVNAAEDNGQKLLYGGFYHLCGNVIQGESAWTPDGGNSCASHWQESKTYEIAPGFHVSFQSECDMLEEVFSMPTIQMEVSFHLPWMLKKKNTYL